MLKLFKSKAFIFSICIIITILNTTVLANNFDFSIYNGETKLQLTNSPYIKDDEIYLPLREILQQFGAYDIIWNDGNIQIEYTNTMEYDFDNCCTFSIGSSELRFFPSNDAIHLRSAPDLVNGITYVPTDFFYNLITKTIVLFGLAILFNLVLELLVLTFIYSTLRLYGFGLHAKTSLQC